VLAQVIGVLLAVAVSLWYKIHGFKIYLPGLLPCRRILKVRVKLPRLVMRICWKTG